MSLINKMLQDLDARGSRAGAALASDVRAAGPVRRRLPARQIAMAASLLVIGGALALVFWLRRPVPVNAPAVVVLVPKVVAPPAPPAPVLAQVAPVVAPQVVSMPQTAPPVVIAQEPTFPVAPAVVPAERRRAPPLSAERAYAPRVRVVRPVRASRVAPLAPEERVAEPQRLPAPVAASTIGGRDMNSAQRAETHYRTALAALEEGRVSAALEGLEQALKLHPRHDAARQSLVALLIEAGRNDEAMQQLQQALAIDAAQPTMAMLLARMQIERGNSGVATLLRTLPSAAGNGDYHAFLAGALQRDGRHREAAEQYGAALRTMPEHGVWLMGLGISLQAEKRDRDALAAFQRAKASGTLTAPLQAFVERKIAQLAP